MTEEEIAKLKETLNSLANGIAPRTIDESIPCAEELKKIKTFYEEIGQFIQEIYQGKLDAELIYKGSIAGSLKMLQAVLKHLTWQTSEVANGDFSQRVDFMGEFADSFNLMVDALKDSFQKFEEKNNQLLKFQNEFEKDIKMAEDAQIKMMQFLPETPFTRGEKYYAALQRVSGDFYHEFMDDSGVLNVFAGDATGHGVSAGLVTMMARTAIESVAGEEDTGIMLERINGLLCNCLPDEMYISGVLCRIHADGKILVASAGHFPVVIVRKATGTIDLTSGGGMPLGMFESGIATFEEEVYHLSPGDRIFLFTDGAVECRNSQEQFGVKRLHELLLRLKDEDIEVMIGEIIGEIWDFCAETGFEDDVLLLTHEYTGSPVR